MAMNIRQGQGSNILRVTAPGIGTLEVGEVINRCVAGEELAWRDLHRSYYPLAACFLRRMGIPAAELDDACQEVFVQVFRYLSRFEHRAEFRTWLYKLCLSQANRVRRRKRVHQALEWLLGREVSAYSTAVQPGWSDAMVARRAGLVLDKMKAIHREVFVLFELEGVDGEEIARVLHCPPATVRRRLHYARAEFETLLRAGTEDEKS